MNTLFEQKLAQFKNVGICVLQDDSSNRKRAVVLAAAWNISTDTLNRLISLSNSISFVTLSNTRAESLLLQPMQTLAHSSRYPSSLVSVDAREGITTGISANDRKLCLHALADPKPNPASLVKPGHIFPLTIRTGGSLERNALPEGASDLVRATAENEVAVFMDLLTDTGRLMTENEQQAFSKNEALPMFTLSEVVQYRLRCEQLITRIAEAVLPSKFASEVRSIVYRSKLHEGEHIALVKGVIDPNVPTLTRVQTENTFSDVFGGSNYDSRASLHSALRLMEEQTQGVLLYLRRPMRGALAAQLFGRAPQPTDTSSMMRDYGIGAQILRDLGIKKINLLSHNAKQLVGLETFGLEIVSRTPLFSQSEPSHA